MHRLRPLHRALHRTLSQAPHRQSPRWPPTPPWNQRQTHQPRTAATPPPPPGTPAQRLQLSYHDLERALERRGLNTVRVLLLSSLAAAAGFGLAWPRIKRWGAVEGAEVAAASLETERLQQRALGMVREVLTDERTGRQVERVIKEAAVGVLRDNEFKASAVEWCAAVLAEALRWEEVRDEGERYLGAVVEGGRERVEEVLAEVVANVARDENVQDKVAKVCLGRSFASGRGCVVVN